MRTIFPILLSLICMISTSQAALSAGRTPDRNGVSIAGVRLTAVRYPSGAPETVRFAASELAKYLDRATGAQLVVSEGAPAKGAFFVSASLPGVVSAKALKGKHDRAVVSAKGGCVYLTGENDRSALYAVYDLLQQFAGIEFLGPGERHEYIPPARHIKLPAKLRAECGSDFSIRDYYVEDYPGGEGFVAKMIETVDFLAKNRINSVATLVRRPAQQRYTPFLTELHKRGMTVRGPGHVWGEFVPDASLFAEHPEYFPVVDGKRTVNGRTACFSNPKVVELFLAKVRNYILENRGTWDIFAFWPEDVPDEHYCNCPECIKRPNVEWYLMLVAKAAKIVEEEAPGTQFEFIAYHSTRAVPTTKTEFPANGRNMLLDLCLGYDRDMYRPINADVPNNKEVIVMLENWQRYLKSCGYRGKTLIMDYFNLCQYPDMGPRMRAYLWPLEIIQQDARYYHSHGLDGAGDWVCLMTPCFPTPYMIWAWTKIRSDTDVNLTKLEDRFYPAYFGTAGGRMRDYMHRLTALMHEKTTEANIAEIENLATTLENVPNDGLTEAVRHRIEVLRVHAQYCVLLKKSFLAFASGDPAKWEPYGRQLKVFFTETNRSVLKDEIDIPPMFCNLWWDLIEQNPGFAKDIAQNPMLH